MSSPTAVNASSGAEAEPESGGYDGEGVNVVGLFSIIVFYLVVLGVGLWAGWKQRRDRREMEARGEGDQSVTILAGRNIGPFVGVLTMGATWVGGGFLNGSAEVAYNYGLIWVQASFGFGLSLFISGTFFARKMRDAKYVTMIDPFTQKFGKWGALQALVAAMSEVFWSASILGALGSTLEVILHIDTVTSIIVSAVIAVLYTLMGGLVSVAYTDVFQIFFIFIGMFLSLPFAATHPAVSSIDFGTTDWKGELPGYLVGEWIDFAFLLLLGGIPWQAYFQRVLSSQSSTKAQYLSYGGGVIAIICAVPATLFGGVAKATDWTQTGFGHTPTEAEGKLVLPLCLQYLTPTWVSFFGLGAVSAAVMSSTDSSMLSASSMIARNVYGKVFRPNARDREILVALWVFIVINAFIATSLAITYQSIYNLFVLCGDFVYVITFPQLFLVLYYEKSNTYGSVAAFFFGVTLRLLCGDTLLQIPPTISFGEIHGENEGEVGPVPFRTIVMLLSIVLMVGLSWITHHVFTERKLGLEYDFLNCYRYGPDGEILSRGTRYLEGEDGISLDDLANQGNFIPRAKTTSQANKDFR